MRHRWIIRAFGIALLFTIVIAGFGQAVLQLWNWLMPSIFGLRSISFWQAVGLLALSWILFGGLRGFGGLPRGRGYRGMRARWEQMTPEEREKFGKGLESRCGKSWKAPGVKPEV
jgi:hypothetical protein